MTFLDRERHCLPEVESAHEREHRGVGDVMVEYLDAGLEPLADVGQNLAFLGSAAAGGPLGAGLRGNYRDGNRFGVQGAVQAVP
ncbi:Uncharacterised protein [Mycobacteroides abscessus subsp. massiliense]|nr:Uncharacterised protein [Mycobacteroides abscessus subsp. massiliense]